MGESTISELDIYRSARQVILQYGEDAWLHAATRADALLEEGDVEGQKTWIRILKAVNKLQARMEQPQRS